MQIILQPSLYGGEFGQITRGLRKFEHSICTLFSLETSRNTTVSYYGPCELSPPATVSFFFIFITKRNHLSDVKTVRSLCIVYDVIVQRPKDTRGTDFLGGAVSGPETWQDIRSSGVGVTEDRCRGYNSLMVYPTAVCAGLSVSLYHQFPERKKKMFRSYIVINIFYTTNLVGSTESAPR